ncbi:hypothetical protein VNO80_09910 [Phaseolus coccineus]|uniref:Uncharacterized protein n=1 Tax=Phaseolus coccineus TaxID=3886 RepID=A0AAN9N733_PHACN
MKPFRRRRDELGRICQANGDLDDDDDKSPTSSAQSGKGQKEREVLGTSSQWVALSGHCPSATVSNVKGGEIGDGVAEHVLILKDCHQTNPVEGRRRTTLSKPTREGTEPSPPSLHISYSFIHSHFTVPPPLPCDFHVALSPRGTCHNAIGSKTLHPSHQTRVFVLVAPRIPLQLIILIITLFST